MLKVMDQTNLDWHRNKVIEVKKRGNISLINPKSLYGENSQSHGKSRCVWPSMLETYESKYLSRRIWGR